MMALMKPGDIQLRRVTEDELRVLEEFMKKENWILSEQILRATYFSDPRGFMIAVNKNNEPLGFVAMCNLNDSTASSGYAIFKEEFRGQKIGGMLFNELEKHVGNRSIVTQSLPEGMGFFTRKRFSKTGPMFHTYSGIPNVSNLNLSLDKTKIIKLSTEVFPAVVNYDESVHVIRREKFLSKLLFSHCTTTVVATNNLVVVGYGCIHQRQIPGKAYMIAPMFADDINIATIILNNLLVTIEPGSSVSMDVPITQSGGQQLAESLGLKCMLTSVRMCRGEHPPVPWRKVFFATTDDISVT